MQTASPALGAERISLLDSLRGIAILGILLMNIPYFALPDPAQFYDLAALDEMGSVNEKVWWVITWVFNGTQRALFALLFGAGIILFTQRQEQKIPGVKSAEYYFRRQLWLMAFGLINFYVLLWIGDYLFPYACCGMVLYVFRNLSPAKLLIGAGVCLLIMTVDENRELYKTKRVISRGEAVASLDTAVNKLTPKQQEQLTAMKALKDRSAIENRKKLVESSKMKMAGDYDTLYKYQVERGMGFFIYLAYYEIWSLLLFMFIGMAFYKNGVLLNKAPARVYWLLFIAGLAAGLPLSWYRLDLMMQHAFSRYDYMKELAFNFTEIARVLRALGLFGLVILMYRSGWFGWLFRMLRPVGQMAFSNYLGQSLLMGIVFYGTGYYGIGQGWFGKMERYEIYYVVAAAWLFQIIFSHVWMRFFQFGPLEWIWRQLTYWKRFPLRKS